MAEALVEVGIRLGAALVEVGVGLWDDQKRKEKKEAGAVTTTADPETGRAQPPAGSAMAGYFIKEGHVRKTWKRRWFVLKGSTVTYYKTEKDKGARGKIKLKKARVYVTTRHTDKVYGACAGKGSEVNAYLVDLWPSGGGVERECVVIEDTRYGKTFHFFPCCQTKAAEGRQIQEWLGVVEECGGSVVQGPPRKQ
ncbi:PH domain containing protein [Acanthamoeba castellanii str. Neff]|uniref:PH domain containing protein n=1 Tax=Acanthamoeba castellanii (strain ATCC 30010 / Neff) TaxID=1257118 RepID=L8HID1_ACACF|nr:PH domain containing protein [Acanthamoeba castellanii str. Neff]ELR24965.1 PH domain containing protein [Acanthamoeba castellanii str. Neff]